LAQKLIDLFVRGILPELGAHSLHHPLLALLRQIRVDQQQLGEGELKM